MDQYPMELWVEGERFEIAQYSLNISRDLDKFNRPTKKTTILFTVHIPFATLEPETIKDWITKGKLIKDIDFLNYEGQKIVAHRRMFEGYCSQYDEYYNDETSKLYISFSIHPKRITIEPLISNA